MLDTTIDIPSYIFATNKLRNTENLPDGLRFVVINQGIIADVGQDSDYVWTEDTKYKDTLSLVNPWLYNYFYIAFPRQLTLQERRFANMIPISDDAHLYSIGEYVSTNAGNNKGIIINRDKGIYTVLTTSCDDALHIAIETLHESDVFLNTT